MKNCRSQRTLLLGIVVTLLSMLAACGGDTGKATGDTSGNATTSAAATAGAGTETAAAELTTEPITLTVLDHSSFPDQPGTGAYASIGKGLQAVDEAFMKLHPNITIKHTPVGFDEHFARMRTAIAAQQGPDVMYVYGGVFAASFSKGLIPLEDRLTDQQKDELQFLDISVSPDGHLYDLPWEAYGYIIVYNKEYFTKAGLDPENPPTTWADFLAACDALNAVGITPMAAGWKDNFYTSHFVRYPFITMLLTPEELAQWGRLEYPMTSPKLAQAFNYFLEMENRKCFTPMEEANGRSLYDDVQNDFGAGKAAMISWYDIKPDWMETLGKDNLDMMLYPLFPDSPHGEQIMDSGPNGGWSIGKWTEHPEEAWAYISFLVSAEAEQIMLDVSGENPNNRAVETVSDYPPRQKFLNWLKNPKNATSYMGYTEEQESLGGRFSTEVLAGRMTVAEYWERLEKVRVKAGPELRGEK
jgi:raffinose/stachyose/melibiose transport system substrate-binding protein